MKTAYLGNISLALLASTSLLITAAPAYAQSSDGASLDEIVVTAQKREENLQDVPLAVTAIGADKIDQLGIQGTADISGLAPNVTIVGGTTSLGAAVVSIRGIPSPAIETFGLDSANAFYIDGVYIARSAAAGLDSLDVGQVEILRGPQGTLFGRNSTGGAISFASKAPTEEFGVKAEFGVGNFDAYKGKVTLNTGRIGAPGEVAGLSTSFTYSHSQRDGVVDNILEESDSNDPGARNTEALRFISNLDFNDTTSLKVIADYSTIDGRAQAFQLTNASDGAPRPPVDVNGQLVVQTQPAPLAEFLAGATFVQPECAALAAPQRSRRDEICLPQDRDVTEETWGVNVQFKKDFGFARLKTISAYREWDSNVRGSDLSGVGTLLSPLFTPDTLLNGGPVDFLPFVGVPAAFAEFVANSPVPTTTQSFFDTNAVREHSQFSQEIEISGDTDNLDWVVGGFYFTEEGQENNPQNSGFVLNTDNIFLGNFGDIGPAFVASNPAPLRLVQTNAVLDYEADADSYAGYGQLTYYPFGRDGKLNLTAGGRYTSDDKQLTRFQDGTAPLAVPLEGDDSFDKFTWNVAAGYELNEEIDLFARVATGYRSGGFNASDPVLDGTTELSSFGDETITSYEVGFKSELFDRRVRLNASAYYNEFDDLVVVTPIAVDGGTFGTQLTNAGDVTYTGFEVEGQALITNNLSIDGTLGYVDVDFNEFLGGTPVEGTAPVNIASLVEAQYTSPLTANIAVNWQQSLDWKSSQFRARVGYTHEDGKFSFSSTLNAPFNDEIEGDDRDLIDAQVGIYDIDIGDEGAAWIQLWGKNLTDGGDFVRGVDFGPLGYAGGYFADPRTYGVTFGIEY